MKKHKLDEILKEIGLPEDTEWLGYAIHSLENDDFLMNYESNEYKDSIMWIGFPDKAKKFQSIKKAEKVRDKIKPNAEVVWLFDIGSQVVVTQPEGYGNMPLETKH